MIWPCILTVAQYEFRKWKFKTIGSGQRLWFSSGCLRINREHRTLLAKDRIPMSDVNQENNKGTQIRHYTNRHTWHYPMVYQPITYLPDSDKYPINWWNIYTPRNNRPIFVAENYKWITLAHWNVIYSMILYSLNLDVSNSNSDTNLVAFLLMTTLSWILPVS